MNRGERRILVSMARKLVRKHVPASCVRQACLYHAWAICSAAASRGHRLVLQAGSAFWPRVPPELDDGICDTHFGYQYTPGPVVDGAMPEIHVWAGDPAAQELIDLTTGTWPLRAQELHGLAWFAPRPPDYVWCKPAELPEGVLYKPNAEATRLAGHLLEYLCGLQLP